MKLIVRRWCARDNLASQVQVVPHLPGCCSRMLSKKVTILLTITNPPTFYNVDDFFDLNRLLRMDITDLIEECNAASAAAWDNGARGSLWGGDGGAPHGVQSASLSI